MGRKYTFSPNRDEIYFITCTAIRWIDIFTRDGYRQIVLDSISYCQQHKGLDVYAWVIMSNHVHMIVGRHSEEPLGKIIGSFKSFTAKRIKDELASGTGESRKDWLQYMFERAGTYNPNNKEFQLWQQDGSHPVLLETREMLFQRLHYLHYNPVRAGHVFEPQHWRWSSAVDYSDLPGLLPGVIIID